MPNKQRPSRSGRGHLHLAVVARARVDAGACIDCPGWSRRRGPVARGQRRRQRGPLVDGRVARLGEPVRHPQPSGQVELVPDTVDEAEVARFGQQQLDVGVGHVARQVLAAPRVVEADHHRAGERRAAQGEDVLGGVVEQHRHVRRAGRIESVPEEGGVAGRLGVELGVRPDLVPEAHRRPVPEVRVGGVAPQQGGRVRSRQRRAGEGGEGHPLVGLGGCDDVDGAEFSDHGVRLLPARK